MRFRSGRVGGLGALHYRIAGSTARHCAVLLLAAALGSALPAPAAGQAKGGFLLASPSFTSGGAIPAKYTCDGENVSPALLWARTPEGAKSLALIVEDPDVPDPKAPKRTWVHWVVYNLPTDGVGLRAAITQATLPAGALHGANDWGRQDYGGPCPPIGRHRYFFKLYALDTVLPELASPTRENLDAAMKGHVIGQTGMVGTFERELAETSAGATNDR